MHTRYSRGDDLPPLMRDSLLADETAAAAFSALSDSAQQTVTGACAGMSSRSQIDEYIALTDNFLFCIKYTINKGCIFR